MLSGWADALSRLQQLLLILSRRIIVRPFNSASPQMHSQFKERWLQLYSYVQSPDCRICWDRCHGGVPRKWWDMRQNSTSRILSHNRECRAVWYWHYARISHWYDTAKAQSSSPSHWRLSNNRWGARNLEPITFLRILLRRLVLASANEWCCGWWQDNEA